MENDPHVQCDRASARRVQAADQDPDRAAFRGNCRDAVLGPAGFWPDHNAQGGRLAKPRREAFKRHMMESKITRSGLMASISRRSHSWPRGVFSGGMPLSPGIAVEATERQWP